MKTSIYEKLNRQNTLDDFIRISDIKSETQLKQLRESGYFAGFTEKSWAEAFPEIPAENIVCQKSILFPSMLYYYEKECSICFPLQICDGTLMYIPGGNTGTEEEKRARLSAYILKTCSELYGAYESKDYRRLLHSSLSEGSGYTTLRLLVNLLHSEEPSPQLYSAFLSAYSFCDCGASLLGREEINLLLACKSDAQKEATAAALKDQPDTITVYRGEGSSSTSYRDALSWTMDENTAYFFAARGGDSGSRVHRGVVKKSDVLEYIEDRNEAELLIIPGSVRVEDTQTCLTWLTFQKLVNASGIQGIPEYDLQDLHARVLVQDIRELYRTEYANEGGIHTADHSIRVSLLSACLGHLNLLGTASDDKVIRKRRMKIYRCLLTAAKWHDLGRCDDTYNETHGDAGAELYLERQGKDKIVDFLIRYHCRSDEDAKEYWKKNFSSTPGAPLIWTAFCILKDADALDRWRFGHLSPEFVDIRRLRLKTSKQLMPIASQLQDVDLTDDEDEDL